MIPISWIGKNEILVEKFLMSVSPKYKKARFVLMKREKERRGEEARDFK